MIRQIALAFLMVCLCEGAQSAVAPAPPADWPEGLFWHSGFDTRVQTTLKNLVHETLPDDIFSVSCRSENATVIQTFHLKEQDLKSRAVFSALGAFFTYAASEWDGLSLTSRDVRPYDSIHSLYEQLMNSGKPISLELSNISFALEVDDQGVLVDGIPYNRPLFNFADQSASLGVLHLNNVSMDEAFLGPLLDRMPRLLILALTRRHFSFAERFFAERGGFCSALSTWVGGRRPVRIENEEGTVGLYERHASVCGGVYWVRGPLTQFRDAPPSVGNASVGNASVGSDGGAGSSSSSEVDSVGSPSSVSAPPSVS